MPRVIAKPDTLNDRNAEFEQTALAGPVFLNSVPKSGTHLMRNIVRMFVPVEQQYHDAFIQHAILGQHRAAFDASSPKLSWGHLLFSDASAIALRHVRHVLLVRDPYDWVLARARFFLSDTFQAGLDHLKNDTVTANDVINMMIFGIHGKAPTLSEIYTHNAVSWIGTDTAIFRYEDLLHHVKHLDMIEAHAFFDRLLKACGVETLPEDWRERVRVGSDREQSGTARENLANMTMTFPNELSDAQKALVDYAAPGLRAILGYENHQP